MAVIDEAFARKYFPGENPVGKRIHVALLDMDAEIVGVAGHVEHWGLGNLEHQSLQAELYIPLFQLPDKFWSLISNGAGFVARTEGAPLDAASGSARRPRASTRARRSTSFAPWRRSSRARSRGNGWR